MKFRDAVWDEIRANYDEKDIGNYLKSFVAGNEDYPDINSSYWRVVEWLACEDVAFNYDKFKKFVLDGIANRASDFELDLINNGVAENDAQKLTNKLCDYFTERQENRGKGIESLGVRLAEFDANTDRHDDFFKECGINKDECVINNANYFAKDILYDVYTSFYLEAIKELEADFNKNTTKNNPNKQGGIKR